MEECANILRYATRNSLAIVDELGRGTSTTDGVAIAYSVLRYLCEKLRCRVLFATHYHILLEYFRLYDEIRFCFMKTRIDEITGEVIFLYKLTEGESSSSFGIKVAQMMRLPNEIIETSK